MNKWVKIFVTLSVILFAIPSSFAGETSFSPVGYWKTIDDITGKPKAILEIVKTNHQTLNGRIIKTFAYDNEKPKDLCEKCEGEKHNRPIIGLVILEHMKQNAKDSNKWSGGEILDPKTGKVYHCSLNVVDDGKKLNVRGYIGLPLFGRTQTWIKVNNVNG